MKSFIFLIHFIASINAHGSQKSIRDYLTPLLPLDDGHKFPAPMLNPVSSRIKNDCICTPFHLCKTYVLSTTPFEVTDTDGQYFTKSKKCVKPLEVCCEDADLTNENEHMEQSTEASTTYDPYDLSGQSTQKWNTHTVSSIKNDFENKYENSNKEGFDFEKEQDRHPKFKKCGQWNENGFEMGLGGVTEYTARYGEFPSTIVIYLEEVFQNWKKSLKYQCGGSLIKENVVLTAAHCIINKDLQKILVRAGDWDLNTEKELYLHQDRHISKVVIHEKYYSGGLHNDIALIFTDEPFTLQENVQIMCLPEQSQTFDYFKCYASGWGETNKRKINKMKKVEVPVVPRDICEDRLRQTRLSYKFNLHESFICAGGEGQHDTCKGDGGSPLMCPIETETKYLVQAGIVSWGIGCGIPDIPAAYVNVANFRHWIDGEIEG